MADTPTHSEGGIRSLHLLLVAVIAVAFVGYFIGIDYGVPKPDAAEPLINQRTIDRTRDVVPATSYAELRTTDIGPNRDWSSDLKKLRWSAPELLDELPKPDPVAKAAALKQRAEWRAFNGAPPVVPHAINQLSAANCLSCHGDGLKLANRAANTLPHPYMTNCTQCHVPQKSSQFAAMVLADNTFDGQAAPFEGPRAWSGAPPEIPHTTHMRDNCLACHGPLALEGMRSTHPWRQNCLQCHAPSAELDQKFFDTQPPFLDSLMVRNESPESTTDHSP